MTLLNRNSSNYMKKLLAQFKVSLSLYGQSTVAKIRYEQAEEAYNNGNYHSTLIKLEEVQNCRAV